MREHYKTFHFKPKTLNIKRYKFIIIIFTGRQYAVLSGLCGVSRFEGYPGHYSEIFGLRQEEVRHSSCLCRRAISLSTTESSSGLNIVDRFRNKHIAAHKWDSSVAPCSPQSVYAAHKITARINTHNTAVWRKPKRRVIISQKY